MSYRSTSLFISVLLLGVMYLAAPAFCEEERPEDTPSKAQDTGAKTPEGKPSKVVKYGGGVSVIPDERTIILKGHTCVAMNEALEWAVVLSRGKEYESVVAVDADASMIQFALIALGYTAGGGVGMQGDARTPLGDGVIIEVEWEIEGKKTRRRIEELTWNEPQERRMKNTPFVFTGSTMEADPETNRPIFQAQKERLIATLYRDPAAILNNPLKTGMDDIFYIANRRTLPPKGTPVTLYLKPSPKPKETDPSVGVPATEGSRTRRPALWSPTPDAVPGTSAEKGK